MVLAGHAERLLTVQAYLSTTAGDGLLVFCVQL
jgi:hypothetical protein